MSLIDKLLTTFGLANAAAESGVDNLNAEMAANMPDQAQAITDAQHLGRVQEIGTKVAQAALAAKKETDEAIAAKKQLDLKKAAMRKVNTDLNELKTRASGGEAGLEKTIAENTTALAQLVDQVEKAKADHDREEDERVNAQAYLETMQQLLDTATDQYQAASNAVKNAVGDLASAKAKQDLIKLQNEQQKELNAMRNGRPGDSMASAISKRAAAIRVETAGIEAKASAVKGAQAPKVNDVAAAALAAASGAPVTLEDRAAALLAEA